MNTVKPTSGSRGQFRRCSLDRALKDLWDDEPLSPSIRSLLTTATATGRPSRTDARCEKTGRMNEAASTRLRWIDVTKGLCMVLVVLRHTTLWIENEFNDGAVLFWWEFSEFLSPIRMPLFFFISGYLVANAVRRPLSQSRARTIGFFYLYAIWSALFLLRLWIPVPGISDNAPAWHHFFVAIVLPTVFWYIWALAFYFVLTRVFQRVLRSWAPWLLLPLFAIAFTAPLLNDVFIPLIPGPIDALKVGSIALNFVWFYAGANGRPVWDRIMQRATWRTLSVWTALYVVAFAMATVADLRDVFLPALALLAMIATAHVVPLIRAPEPIVRALEKVGALTLPVYIFHIFGVSVISLLVKASGFGTVIAHEVVVSAAIIPPLLTPMLIWFSMVLGRNILHSPARWLMTPDWLRSSPTKANPAGMK